MNQSRLMESIGQTWDRSIVPTLCEYIRIPNKSQAFDPQWAEHGYMDQAADLMLKWCEANALPGMRSEIVRLPGRTPLLFVEIPAAHGGSNDDCILMYGHMDKQPEFTGWAEGLEPWTPVIRNGRLYGRGGADDGYALFGSVLAVRALHEQGIPHTRCVIVIEAGEESSSPDLPAYIDHLSARIGKPSLVVCLDAECGNYEQFWCTTSLRGNLVGTLRVEVLSEGVHSGMASGIVASSFRIARQLLARVEDAATGRILVDALHAEIPPDRLAQAQAVAKTLGNSVQGKVPFLPGVQPVDPDPLELTLNSTWRPTLSVTGVDGIPPVQSAGNVLRPMTAFVLSFRLPPTAIRRTAPTCLSRSSRAWAAGMRPRTSRGWKPRCSRRRKRVSAKMRCTWAPAAASPSWVCSGRNSPACSSSSPVCSARIPMRTDRTNSWISKRARKSPRACRTSLRPMRGARAEASRATG
jgi:acetylornithine deacetylase/succinyl-diaminopimelate desuccinylase-like protein